MQQSLLTHLDVWTSALETRSTAGRGSNSKINLYGIKKLRELILELAVQGKLVLQDPNDEPASVLLDKIAAEKAQLIKAGKLKKEKPLPPITDDEKPFELPNGWEWCRFHNVTNEIATGPFGSMIHKSDYIYGGIPLINPSHMINSQVIEDQSVAVSSKKAEELAAYKVAKNDIVMARRGEMGRCALITERESQWLCGTGSFLLKFHSDVSRHYIILLLSTTWIKSYLGGQSIGTTMINLNHNILNKMPIAVPPEKEQQRIVAKVDELMALCDALEQEQTATIAAHQTLVEQLLAALTQGDGWERIATHFDTLFTTENSIDQLKQTILQLAVMGKLVPQDPNDEPASVLLEKIAAEKAQLIKAGKLKKEKPLPPITDDEKPFELPNGWEWENLGSLISIMDSGWSPACLEFPARTKEIWGVLKTTSVQNMVFHEAENKELPDRLEPKPQYEVKTGDILITRAGPKNRVGISCLVEKVRPKLMISDKIIRLHLITSKLYEPYIVLCLNSGATANYLENAKSGMADSQVNISQDKLRLSPIPLCPLAEQQRIVAKVDELMALCDALKAEIRAAQTTQLHLADALTESF